MKLTTRHIAILLIKVPLIGLALVVVLIIAHVPLWLVTVLACVLAAGGAAYVVRDGMKN
jgi:hypothetical protein